MSRQELKPVILKTEAFLPELSIYDIGSQNIVHPKVLSLASAASHHPSLTYCLFNSRSGLFTFILITLSHSCNICPTLPSPLCPTAPKSRTKRRIMMRQIQHILRQTCRLNHTPNLHRALILYQRPNRPQQLRAKLRIPSILPSHKSNNSSNRLSRVLLLFKLLQNSSESFRAEADV